MAKLAPDRDVQFNKTEMEPDPLISKDSTASTQNIFTDSIEELACWNPNPKTKRLFTFDKSLERLISAGYIRHLRPAEAFGIVISGIEGTLAPELQPIYDDMIESYGEWLSIAFETKGNTLTTYLDPAGLIWNEQKSDYEKKSFSFTEKREFDISELALNQWTLLQNINPELTEYLYGRQYEELPNEIQQKARVYIPEEGMGRPVGRGSNDDNFNLLAYIDLRASRGVRDTQPPKKTRS